MWRSRSFLRGRWGQAACRRSKDWNHGAGMATLAFDELLVPDRSSEGMRTVMFVHGLLGSGRNWRTFAKRLATRAQEQSPANFPGWRLMMIDLRNHGRSASVGFGPPHDMPAAAKDIVDLVRANSQKWPDIVVSHSMGGKVALEYAQKASSGLYGDVQPPKQLWILDSVPGVIPVQNEKEGEVEKVLATIMSLPDPILSRRWLIDHMIEKGFSKSLSDWLGSNLKRTGSGEEMTWVFKPKEAFEMFNAYRESDYWPVLENPPNHIDVHIVRASRSDRWSPSIVSRLEALSTRGDGNQIGGKVFYHVLQDAGHWLHVDNPDGLADILLPSFVKLAT